MANPTDKSTLLAKMHSARKELNATIASLSAEQLTAPGPEAWSVKDHLAHLAAWARKEVAVLAGRSPSEGLGLPEGSYESYDFDELNAMLLPHHQAMTLGEALDEFNASHAALLEAVEAFPDEKLSQPYRGRSTSATWADGIAGNSYDHDTEHAVWIRELVRS